MFMSERQKMISGLPYNPGDPELQADQTTARHWMARYNASLADSPAERRDPGMTLRNLAMATGSTSRSRSAGTFRTTC